MERRIKSIVKSVPIVSSVARFAYRLIRRNRIEFETSRQYWDSRYMQAGDSGDGSYGRLADFKAEIINGFVDKHRVQEIVEFGCGDGAQLMKMNYPKYTGVDVSPTIVRQCKELFKGNGSDLPPETSRVLM